MGREGTCTSIRINAMETESHKQNTEAQKNKRKGHTQKRQSHTRSPMVNKPKNSYQPNAHLSLRDRVREISRAQLAVVAALRKHDAAHFAVLDVRRRVLGVGLQHDEGAALFGRENLERARLEGRRNDAVRHLVVRGRACAGVYVRIQRQNKTKRYVSALVCFSW